MSLLFPLFFAAAAAIAAPILLHLLRQRARNVQPFSSLMFLRPSPPRMQPKTRVENLPLLLLRCLALILLAIAFARPWWPTADLASIGPGGRTLVLLDTSASMSRTGLWDQALAHLDQIIAEPEQRLALVTFDRSLRHVVGFEDWAGRPAGQRADHARARVRGIVPGQAGTDLGVALTGAVELITEDETAVPAITGAKRIILISDLQAGRGLDALRTATWPDGLDLAIRQVSSPQPDNAGLSLVAGGTGLVADALDADAARQRVRVSNDSASTAQTFTLHWSDDIGTPVPVTVPPGSSRVVRAPIRPDGKNGIALVLRGDAHAFDNTVYLSDSAPTEVPVLYLGADAVDDPNGLAYFLKHALQPTRVLAPQLVVQAPGTAVEDPGRFGWVVVGGAPSTAVAEQLTAHVTNGGAVTVVLRQASDATWVERLSGHPLRAGEADLTTHALIGRVDFAHPLLRPFDAALFGDFTKIHIWRHRSVTPPPGSQVLAWYDDGGAAWFELPVGKGRVLVLTSGWHPQDSQLALSTKFVPLIHTELQRSSRIVPRPSQVIIGDQATMPTGVVSLSGPLEAKDVAATSPVAPIVAGTSAQAPTTLIERQGLYHLQTADGAVLLAANLDPLESHTAPLARETLEAIGVKVAQAQATVAGAAEAAAAERLAQRQLKVAEIEARQKSWLWILAAVLAVLMIETVVASVATTNKPTDHLVPAETAAPVPTGATT